MIVIGHKYIEYDSFYEVKNKEDIKNTPSNSTALFDFDKNGVELARYCKANGVTYGIIINNIKELIFSNALGAGFILVLKEFAKTAQKIADDYLFDAKIILLSEDENDIEWGALNGIDGIIFKGGITSKKETKDGKN